MVRIWNPPTPATAVITSALLLLALLPGCDQQQAPNAIDGTLRIVQQGEPSNIDPARAFDESSSQLSRQVFQTLYRYQYLSREARLRPDLAIAMPEISEDQLTYTIRLRTDQRFADDPAFPGGRGRTVQAEDVAYSFKRHLDPATRSAWHWLFRGRILGFESDSNGDFDYQAPLAGIQIVDPWTLRFRLVEPFPAFPHLLAVAGAGIVAKEAVARYGEQFGRSPVGSGPYRLTHLDSTGARLTRNSAYQQRLDLAQEGYEPDQWPEFRALESMDGAALPLMDDVETYFIVDNIPAFLMASASPAADILRVSTEAMPLWEQQRPATHRLATYAGSSVVRFGLNLDGPLGTPTADRTAEDLHALRCAMGRAMDWSSRNRIFYNDSARIHPGIILPGLEGFEDDMPMDAVTYDPAVAVALLADSGWTAESLPAIRYGFQAGVLEQQGFEHFRAMMTAMGWPRDKVQPAVFPTFGDLGKAAMQGAIDVFLRSWILDYPDAENVLALYYGANAPGANFERYRNPSYDRLYERIQSIQAGPERSESMSRMNRMLVDDCVFIGSVFRQRSRAISKRLLVRGDASGPLTGTYWRFAVPMSSE
jgi:ABC-type transport system substrate-binding protein